MAGAVGGKRALGTKKTRNVVVLRKERGGYLPLAGGFGPDPRPATMSSMSCLLSSSWYGVQNTNRR